MAHRTQITLSDTQYVALKRRSDATGLSLAELVRQALDRTYDDVSKEERLRALQRSAATWADRDVDGESYVERIRQPGLGARLGP